ncbi:MAG TPA: hypothetical protein VEL77_15045 [Rugosimonospora sp.]|nr:hypothetical protein [Rugosimonospora sp.]
MTVYIECADCQKRYPVFLDGSLPSELILQWKCDCGFRGEYTVRTASPVSPGLERA